LPRDLFIFPPIHPSTWHFENYGRLEAARFCAITNSAVGDRRTCPPAFVHGAYASPNFGLADTLFWPPVSQMTGGYLIPVFLVKSILLGEITPPWSGRGRVAILGLIILGGRLRVSLLRQFFQSAG
jgi:hypothetical protein